MEHRHVHIINGLLTELRKRAITLGKYEIFHGIQRRAELYMQARPRTRDGHFNNCMPVDDDICICYYYNYLYPETIIQDCLDKLYIRWV